MDDLLRLTVMSLATGSISMTLTRSRMFREVRWWLARGRPEWVWDFVKCPWCVSTWCGMAIVAACGPLRLTNRWLVDWAVTWLATVALAPLAALLIHRIYGPLPPVPTEDEWHYDNDDIARSAEAAERED